MTDERIAQLRSATHRVDGSAAVELLAGAALDRDALQLTGDAIRVALATGAPGAQELAVVCADALRQRCGWGDEQLAER